MHLDITDRSERGIMLKLLVTAIALTLCALVLTSAVSAAPSARDPRVPALQAKIRTLDARVSSLADLVNRNTAIANRNTDLADCRFVYQIRFNRAVVNLFAAILGAPQDNSPLPSDNGACQRAGIAPPPFRSLAATTPLGTMKRLMPFMATLGSQRLGYAARL